MPEMVYVHIDTTSNAILARELPGGFCSWYCSLSK